jgi:hypothetical protein
MVGVAALPTCAKLPVDPLPAMVAPPTPVYCRRCFVCGQNSFSPPLVAIVDNPQFWLAFQERNLTERAGKLLVFSNALDTCALAQPPYKADFHY